MDSSKPTESSPLYIAVIGDLVGSRLLPDRGAVQERLKETLSLLNHSFRECIVSRFLITLGDEVQGLLEAPAPISDIWWTYQRSMHELTDTRFSFGLGTLSTALREEALGMDGPCFYAARDALTFGHKEHLNITFGVHGRHELTSALNRLSKLVDKTIKHWSPVQWETVLGLHQLGSQVKVAEARGVKKQSVHSSLQASSGLECLEYWRGIDQLFHSLVLE